MTLTDNERQELEELRAFKARYELTEKDMRNPNVLLIEGKLGTYDGNYTALSVSTKTGLIYLTDVVNNLVNWDKAILTFSYHISSEPKGYYELEEHLVQTVMGQPQIKFYHHYSDLTVYLWTDEMLKCGGHDILKELLGALSAVNYNNCYLAMRVEKNAQ